MTSEEDYMVLVEICVVKMTFRRNQPTKLIAVQTAKNRITPEIFNGFQCSENAVIPRARGLKLYTEATVRKTMSESYP